MIRSNTHSQCNQHELLKSRLSQGGFFMRERTGGTLWSVLVLESGIERRLVEN